MSLRLRVPDAFRRVRPVDVLFRNPPKLQAVPPETLATPEVPAMPFVALAGHLRQPEYKTPDIFSTTLDGALYWPDRDVVLAPDRRVVAESINLNQQRRVVGQPRKLPIGEPVEGHATVFRSLRNGHYHTLVDNIPRLSLLHQPEYADLTSIQILCGSDLTPVEAHLVEKVAPPNAKVVIVPPDRLYPVEHLILATPLTRRFAGYLPAPYRAIVADRLTPRRPRRRDRRIFVTRHPDRAAHGRCIVNESEIEPMLQAAGFQRYRLEDLSFPEQIELFYDAEMVVAPHGAGLANLMFSESVDVVELFPTPEIYPHYFFLARSFGHRYSYLCGHLNHNSDFAVDGAALGTLLAGIETRAERARP